MENKNIKENNIDYCNIYIAKPIEGKTTLFIKSLLKLYKKDPNSIPEWICPKKELEKMSQDERWNLD